MKKILAVLMAIILFVSASLPVAGAISFSETTALFESLVMAMDEEEPTEPETPDPEDPAVPDENAPVAELYLCTRYVLMGHVWIYVENLKEPVIDEDGTVVDDGSIKVGCYTCPSGKGVSVGTALMSRANGMGNYYNVESYMLKGKNLKNIDYVKMQLTQTQLEKVNKTILKSNQWTPFTNCGFFACRVWNSVSDRHIAYGVFPFITSFSIIDKRTKEEKNETISFKEPSRDEVFKQKGKGDKATLKEVSDASLVAWVG